jgi:thiamine biosynthesis lipoprotein
MGIPLGRELNACGIIGTMQRHSYNPGKACTFDRVRASGFRLVFALALLTSILVPTAAHADWITRDEAIMGTRCAVELWSDDKAKGEAAITSVFDDMKRIDRLMSTWKEDTEISKVNREGGTHPVKISRELFKLLQVSVEYSELTRGAFDITYASVGYLYDFKKGVHPDQKAIDQALPGINWRHMVLDEKKTTVFFTRPGMRIDLGGIAKGYSVDRGIEILQKQGITRAMVNAGGDTRIIGDRFGKPWVVGVRDPDHEGKVFLRLPLTDTAFSTSGDYERYFDENGKRFHHIIDPKTGDSARKCRSVTIISGNATRTDALTKSVFIMGPEEGIAFIDTLPDVDAVAVAPDGRVIYSKGLAPPQ